jgi:hypothetical protein
MLIFTNYSTSTIGVQALDADGGLDGPLNCSGHRRGPETER